LLLDADCVLVSPGSAQLQRNLLGGALQDRGRASVVWRGPFEGRIVNPLFSTRNKGRLQADKPKYTPRR